MSPKAKRLSIIAMITALVGVAAMLVLGALRDNIVFFYTPTEITTSGTKAGQALRLGGLVKDGSVKIDGLQSVFTVTDGSNEISVRYDNALPSLFREGQGVVAEGALANGEFIATNVLDYLTVYAVFFSVLFDVSNVHAMHQSVENYYFLFFSKTCFLTRPKSGLIFKNSIILRCSEKA